MIIVFNRPSSHHVFLFSFIFSCIVIVDLVTVMYCGIFCMTCIVLISHFRIIRNSNIVCLCLTGRALLRVD